MASTAFDRLIISAVKVLGEAFYTTGFWTHRLRRGLMWLGRPSVVEPDRRLRCLEKLREQIEATRMPGIQLRDLTTAHCTHFIQIYMCFGSDLVHLKRIPLILTGSLNRPSPGLRCHRQLLARTIITMK